MSGILETTSNILGSSTGVLTYDCGNLDCNGRFTVIIKSDKPLVCPQCGEEIDWEGFTTRIKRICPKCNKEFFQNEKYCPYHKPKVAIEDKQVEIMNSKLFKK
ncbi:MAG: hypothetical protein ACTSRG_08330 [Candidatus Helarchaeota archaeon]